MLAFRRLSLPIQRAFVTSPLVPRAAEEGRLIENRANKVAIVTGASHDVGAAVAERLAVNGFTVIVNYAHDEAKAEALVTRIEAAGGRAVSTAGDVSDAATVARIFDSAEAAFGGVDVLVNCADILEVAHLAESDDASFDRQVATNLRGSFNTLRQAARRMRDGGRIVSLSSSVVGLSLPGYAVYAATKVAVEAMTLTLVKELRSHNITVNAIAPATTDASTFLGGKAASTIADVIAFIVGPDGGWINGQVLRESSGTP